MRPPDEPLEEKDTRFAGQILLTARLADLADELKKLNRSLDQIIDRLNHHDDGEVYRWKITRRM